MHVAEAQFSWLVPAQLPAFVGHFPGQPIVPGVVLLDLALLFAQQHLGQCAPGWQITQAKFLNPCGPGDLLVFAFRDGARGALAFSVCCAGRTMATGSLLPPCP